MDIQWKNIIGHEDSIRRLRSMLSFGRLPHALLLIGPDGIGKRRVAEVLAAAILCDEGIPCGACPSCRAMIAGTHPDYYAVEAEAKGTAARSIKIEQIRKMQAETARIPVLSGRRVVLVDHAELMNEAAENSLLKTLEEPAGQVTFLLTATAREALLETIVSRCVPVSFGMLPQSQLSELLRVHGVPKQEAGTLAALADGSVGRALALYGNGGMKLRDDAVRFLEGLGSMDMDMIWRRGKEMGDLEREKVSEWFLYLSMLLRDMLALYGDGGTDLLYHQDMRERLLACLQFFPMVRVFRVLELVREMQRRLQANVNLRLLMEGFLIRMMDLR